MMTKEEILNLLADNKTEKAIAALKEATLSDESLHDEIVMLSNSYEQLEKTGRLGKENFSTQGTERSRIVDALIKITHKLPADTKNLTTRLIRPRKDVFREMNDLVNRGNKILELLRESPPQSESDLYEKSAMYWHDGWRAPLEQIITQSFSPSKPLKWLKKIPLSHKNYGDTWQRRGENLYRDMEAEIAFLRDLMARLDNYQEELTVPK